MNDDRYAEVYEITARLWNPSTKADLGDVRIRRGTDGRGVEINAYRGIVHVNSELLRGIADAADNVRGITS